jgi:hypothetical protein
MSIAAMKQALEALENPWKSGPEGVAGAITALRSAIDHAKKQGQHWCTYCRGHNAHNCQFNTTIPRVHTYVTNTTAPAPNQWVGLTEDEKIRERKMLKEAMQLADEIEAVMKGVEAKLKEKNT